LDIQNNIIGNCLNGKGSYLESIGKNLVIIKKAYHMLKMTELDAVMIGTGDFQNAKLLLSCANCKIKTVTA